MLKYNSQLSVVIAGPCNGNWASMDAELHGPHEQTDETLQDFGHPPDLETKPHSCHHSCNLY